VHPADIAKGLGTARGLLHHDTLLVEMRSKSKLLIVDFDQSVLVQQNFISIPLLWKSANDSR
jgi:hypothetical protein